MDQSLVVLTEDAKQKLTEAIGKSKMLPSYIRIEAGGGCACCGPAYQMSLTDTLEEGDVVEEVDGIKIVSSKESAEALRGSRVDYYEGLEGSGFVITNPNTPLEGGGCACGGH
ncbi:MAG: iron-sulfur cluster assembly accessory protein [Thermoprotei archaeon]